MCKYHIWGGGAHGPQNDYFRLKPKIDRNRSRWTITIISSKIEQLTITIISITLWSKRQYIKKNCNYLNKLTNCITNTSIYL